MLARSLPRRSLSGSWRALSGSLPLVGVASDIDASEKGRFADKHGVGDKYIRSLAEWGDVVPVILPSLLEHHTDKAAWARTVLDGLDGIMLAGNPSNVHPSCYGQAAEPHHPPFDQPRDEMALLLARHAVEMGVPLLGVCRGLQEINVAMGGSLKTLDHTPIYHGFPDGPPDTQYGEAHAVKLAPDGALAAILADDELMVNSCHNQALDRIADGVRVEGTAPDGVVEAISVAGADAFAMAVQWHPEYKPEARRSSQRLYGAFGKACRERQEARRAARRTDCVPQEPVAASAAHRPRVFVNGCFDLLHVGHLNAYRQAKELCAAAAAEASHQGFSASDVSLVAAIHDTHSISKEKGKDGVLTAAERLELLESCALVDEIVTGVPYAAITPAVLDAYGCRFSAHGSDAVTLLGGGGKDMYHESKRAGRHLTFRRSEGISTTNLVASVVAKWRHDNNNNNDDDDDDDDDGDDCNDHKVVLRKGSGFTPTAQRIEAFRRCHPRRCVNEAKRVVLVTGDFDFLHLGHVRILKDAAALGDYLVVGLVRCAGGARGDTVLSMGERTISLLSCRHVDDVIVDAPLTPTGETLEAIRVSSDAEVVVVRVEGHADFSELTELTDWDHLKTLTTPLAVTIHTMDQSHNTFCTQTIVDRVGAGLIAAAAATSPPAGAATTTATAVSGGVEVRTGGPLHAHDDDRAEQAGVSKELRPYLCPPEKVLQLYSALHCVTYIFDSTGLQWWCVAGTLLGAIRHQGLIPWDDDLDICIHERDLGLLEEGGSVRVALEAKGWTLSTHPDNGVVDSAGLRAHLRPYPFLVAHPRAPWGTLREAEGAPRWFRDPNVDIFVAAEHHLSPSPGDAPSSSPEREQQQQQQQQGQEEEAAAVNGAAGGSVAKQPGPTIGFVDSTFLPRMKMPRSSLYPLRRVPFGELSVSVPAHPEVLLDASYGPSWRTEASLASAHTERRGMVLLDPARDLCPATPTGPIMRSVQDMAASSRGGRAGRREEAE